MSQVDREKHTNLMLLIQRRNILKQILELSTFVRNVNHAIEK